MAKAVALSSGGLDSTLAILVVKNQGIEVQAIKFLTPFDCDISQIPPYPPLIPPLARGDTEGSKGNNRGIIDSRHSLYFSNKEMNVAKKFGFDIKTCRLGDQFLEIVKNPKHGYGKNMNPCIDCRILMLKEAKVFMDEIGAEFIITGEVLGQRPMSQRKEMFYHIDKEAGVVNQVLRPLSAKLLRITVPEAEGIIDRKKLHDFSGRSRKPQIALAEEFGLADYPAPAGGCLLTEPNYAQRLKDLLTHNPEPSMRDIDLLRIGRHFRFSPACKIIVGRDKAENAIIESLSMNNDCLLRVDGYGSPITLVSGEITDEALKIAASLCARYSDAKNMSEIEVTVLKRDNQLKLTVSPANNEAIEALRVEKAKTKNIIKV